MPKSYPLGEGAVRFVSPEWLEGRLGEVSVLDVQPHVHDYIKGHVPGAVYLGEECLRSYGEGLPHSYTPVEALEVSLGRMGLGRGRPVVVYGGEGDFRFQSDGAEPAVVGYSLARFGHEEVYVLDGDVEDWREEGRPVSQEFPVPPERDFQTEVREEFFVTAPEVEELVDSGDALLVDARPGGAFQGQAFWSKPGHIPGAVNLPWNFLVEPMNWRRLRSIEDIEDELDKRGVDRGDEVVCYCGTGRKAVVLFVVLRFVLGFPEVRMFEGSFTEWVARGNPTETGEA